MYIILSRKRPYLFPAHFVSDVKEIYVQLIFILKIHLYLCSQLVSVNCFFLYYFSFISSSTFFAYVLSSADLLQDIKSTGTILFYILAEG